MLVHFRKRRYLGRYFAHPMMQNRRAKRDDYKPSAVRVTQRYVPSTPWLAAAAHLLQILLADVREKAF
ncbi:hypothetical protein [Piscirickettsia salmonis]|uniref:hypothetical protein n=1 Tax=Piscirickettsia salmonis TaxID=1238 RepID=UPI0009B83991|nr:hypothetical protein [Piscirickettsia salmonis]